MTTNTYWIDNLADVGDEIKTYPVADTTQEELKRATLRTTLASATEKITQRTNYAKAKWRNVPVSGKVDPRISDDDKLMVIMSDTKPSRTANGPFSKADMLVHMASRNWDG